MENLIGAYTKAGTDYPGYINIKDTGTGVEITVRGDPTYFEGAFVCGYGSVKGHPGRCTPGDDHCNNYCNRAPEKGPLQDRPNIDYSAYTQGSTSLLSLTYEEWDIVNAFIHKYEQEDI